MNQLARLRRELIALQNPIQAKLLAGYFKTGTGEYGEGDRFYGITVPQLRKLAREYRELGEADINALLASPMHEERFVALAIRVLQYQHGDARTKSSIAKWYVRHASRVNNWDLVDSSASYILGDYLLTRSTSVLDRLARSKNLWQRRIAIIASGAFIREHRFDVTLRIAYFLLDDDHDLMHKAVGWMLREVGKRSKPTLEKFLCTHRARLPRTTLRYAIERFPKAEREKYLRA